MQRPTSELLMAWRASLGQLLRLFIKTLNNVLHLIAYKQNLTYYYYREKVAQENCTARTPVFHCRDVLYGIIEVQDSRWTHGEQGSNNILEGFNDTDNFDPGNLHIYGF